MPFKALNLFTAVRKIRLVMALDCTHHSHFTTEREEQLAHGLSLTEPETNA